MNTFRSVLQKHTVLQFFQQAKAYLSLHDCNTWVRCTQVNSNDIIASRFCAIYYKEMSHGRTRDKKTENINNTDKRTFEIELPEWSGQTGPVTWCSPRSFWTSNYLQSEKINDINQHKTNSSTYPKHNIQLKIHCQHTNIDLPNTNIVQPNNTNKRNQISCNIGILLTINNIKKEASYN